MARGRGRNRSPLWSKVKRYPHLFESIPDDIATSEER